MRTLTQALTLTSMATAVRSAFNLASVNPVLWWDAESHRAGMAGGAATLFQDAAGTSPVTAVEQPVGRAVDQSGNARHALQATSTARPLLTARKNLLTFSEQFDNAAWTKTAVTVTPDDAQAPDGTQTADRLTNTSASAVVDRIVTVAANTPHTDSIYVKHGNNAWLRILYGSGADAVQCWVNVHTGEVGVVTATAGTAVLSNPIVQPAENGFWRIQATVNLGGTLTSFQRRTFFVSSNGGGSIVSGAWAHFWGAQLEYGSTATSYQRIAAATDYDISAAPLMLQFDGSDDGIASATFPAGTLPANADAYLVIWPDADEQESVLVEDPSSSGARYFGVRHPSQSISQSADGPTTASAAFTANGSPVSGTTNPTRAQLFTATRTGVPVLLQITGLNLSAWTQIGLGRYVSNGTGFGYKGRHGCLLIDQAASDSERTKIRKALAKAYQIQGVV